MTDSTEIRILCLLLSAANNPMGSLFSIRLPSQSCVVEKLRESVKHARPNSLDSVDVADLEVWKPRTPEKKLDLNSGEPLTKKIREVFPAEYQPIDDPDMAIHSSDGIYMIRCPERYRFARSGHDDPIRDLQAEFETLTLIQGQSPSSLSQPNQFEKVSGTGAAIGCNRPFEVETVPIALLDEVFAEFKEIQGGGVSPPSALAYHLLDELAIGVCKWHASEAVRSDTIRKIFSKVAGMALDPGVVDGTAYRTDGHLQHCIVPAIIRECKNSGNAVSQAILYYGHFLAFASKTYANCDTRFPSILLIDMGSYMGFYGCVWNGSRIMVEPLSPLFDLSTPVREEAARRTIAYTLDALLGTYKRIADHYSAIKIKSPDSGSTTNPRFYPHRTTYTDERDGKSKTFTYTMQIPGKLVFFAYDNGDRARLCIKFTRRYGADVHRCLAAHGFAPRLRHIIYIGGGWNMVVMDQSPSRYKPLVRLESDLDSESRARVRSVAMSIATLLSSCGFVHGDLRDTNILLDSDALKQEGCGNLHVIDYDWSGPVGEVKYPDRVNTEDIKRPMGVESGAVIEVEHDKEMISLLF